MSSIEKIIIDQEAPDVNIEEEPDVSSIGPTWPPRGTSQDRIKGFDIRQIVTDITQIADYKALYAHAQAGSLGEYVHETFPKENRTTPEYSRFSFRFLARTNLVPEIVTQMRDAVEVVIPLHGSGEFEEMSMVYIGFNDKTRQSSDEDLQVSQANVTRALERTPKSYQAIVENVVNQGYTLETPSLDARKNDGDLRAQISSLYARFDWTPESVAKMLENPTSILCIARQNGEIVSAGIAELAEITIQTEEGPRLFRMVELTEAATLEGHQKKGLYTAVAAEELRALANLPEDQRAHIVLGECNGVSGGVINAARDLGRTFAFQDVDLLGGNVKGYLPQHVPITGTPTHTKHNDLFPAYISAENVQNFAGVIPQAQE